MLRKYKTTTRGGNTALMQGALNMNLETVRPETLLAYFTDWMFLPSSPYGSATHTLGGNKKSVHLTPTIAIQPK